MSIASEITRIKNAVASAYTSCNAKGATMPAVQNVANLAPTIDTITGGGGATATVVVTAPTGSTVTMTKETTTKTATEVSGTWTFSIGFEEIGVWTVNASLGTKSKTETVEVTEATEYLVSIAYSRLPEGYTELEYIESTGTQYIDQLLSMRGMDYGWYIDAEYTSDYSSTPQYITGIRYERVIQRTLGWFSGDYYTPSGAFIMDWRNWAESASKSIVIGTVTKNLRFQTSYIYEADSKMVATKTDGSTVVKTDGSTVTTVYNNWYVFGRWANDEDAKCAKIKLYSFKSYEKAMVVRDFVPCINPSNQVGMYDLVSQQFFGNSGTGSFITGGII